MMWNFMALTASIFTGFKQFYISLEKAGVGGSVTFMTNLYIIDGFFSKNSQSQRLFVGSIG